MSSTSPTKDLVPKHSLGAFNKLNQIPSSEITSQLELIDQDPKFISLLTTPSKQGNGNVGERWNDLYRQVSSRPTYYVSLEGERDNSLLQGYGYETVGEVDENEVFMAG